MLGNNSIYLFIKVVLCTLIAITILFMFVIIIHLFCSFFSIYFQTLRNEIEEQKEEVLKRESEMNEWQEKCQNLEESIVQMEVAAKDVKADQKLNDKKLTAKVRHSSINPHSQYYSMSTFDGVPMRPELLRLHLYSFLSSFYDVRCDVIFTFLFTVRLRTCNVR